MAPFVSHFNFGTTSVGWSGIAHTPVELSAMLFTSCDVTEDDSLQTPPSGHSLLFIKLSHCELLHLVSLVQFSIPIPFWYLVTLTRVVLYGSVSILLLSNMQDFVGQSESLLQYG